MRLPLNVEDARGLAKRRLPRLAFDYIDGGAEDELTLRANRRAFERVTLRPRFFVDVRDRDQSAVVLGQSISMPVLLAPTGLARIAGREGDLAGARAAGEAGTIFTLSTMSTHSLEEVAQEASGPLWFQLYLWKRREVVESLVERAKQAGYQALVVTVDVPIVGNRERDLRNGFTLPPKFRLSVAADMLRHPRWLRNLSPPITFKNFVEADYASPSTTIAHAKWLNEELTNPGMTSDDLRWLREVWKGPLLVKGTLTGEDAERALECGVDGIIVSNHGGRQLDGTAATLDALTEVVAAVRGQADVLLDGGVRRGSDVVKACALGASACLIGRPWLWGLASAGERGVLRVLRILREEIDRTMTLMGCRTLSELDHTALANYQLPGHAHLPREFSPIGLAPES